LFFVALLVLFTLFFVGVLSDSRVYSHTNGQPGCRTQMEFNRLWRNNWDPTRYWKCMQLNVAATQVICPMSTLFLDSAQCCVEVHLWNWTPPFDPPSTP